MIPLSMTGHTTRAIYYRTSIGSHMRSIAWWHFQWHLRTPNPVFKVTAFLKSNISNTVRFMDSVSIEH